MFQDFLRIVKNGNIQSHLEIAEKLGVSPFMVLQIAHELTRRGYLNEFSADCLEQSGSCGGCSVAGACQIMGRTWSLTEKGEKVVLSQS